MQNALPPSNENERLRNLHYYDILDSESEADFDDIVKLASQICETPISLITVIDEDRQWFKARHGLAAVSTPRDIAFCAHNLNGDDQPLVVADSDLDPRFADNPLVTGDPRVKFYAGFPLITPEGHALGSLCVIDHVSREITPTQIAALRTLARQVVKLIELRKANKILEQSQRELKIANESLNEFSYVVAHDLKAPIRNLKQCAEVIKEDWEDEDHQRLTRYVDMMCLAATDAQNMIDGILQYSRAVSKIDLTREPIILSEHIESIFDRCAHGTPMKCRICVDQDHATISNIALSQILTNLISNACKYNDQEDGEVRITVSRDQDFYYFEVQDNGVGMEELQLKGIFKLFYTIKDDKFNHLKRDGIGLNIVKKMVENLGGQVEVTSKINVGTTFKFSLRK